MDDSPVAGALPTKIEEYHGLHNATTDRPMKKLTKWRNIFGFWILGLANNYPYVIMLSAAFDTIHRLSDKTGDHMHNNTNLSNMSSVDSCTLVNGSYKQRELCERAGTSLILLADIVPQFIIKLIAPYFMTFIPYWLRVITVVGFSLSSFLFVGLGLNVGLVIFGILCASISAGFGEITFLSLTARYDKSTVSGWSSGTGAAGVAGALVYAGLTFLISSKATLLIQTFMPLVMLFTFLFILGKAQKILPTEMKDDNGHVQDPNVPTYSGQSASDDAPLLGNIRKKRLKLLNKEEAAYWWEHVKYIPRLWKYMLPLFLVYWAEYMINQGFFELLYNPNTHVESLCISQEAQYRLLQVMYQVGVFLSRSSVSLFQIRWFWIMTVLQMFNYIFFFCAAVYLFLPSFWLTMFIVLYEGLLGGGVYVNAFYAISKEVPKVHREFSMGVASAADTSGITVAAVLAQFVHTFLCSHYIGYKT